MLRRTKVIATLGPSTDEPNVLKKIIQAGVDLVRVNLSHGAEGAHIKRIESVRELSLELGKEIGIILDLQGPKIRIARFKDGSIILKEGKTFVLDVALGVEQGTEQSVGIDYKNLPKDLHKKDILVLDDGVIVLEVTEIQGDKVITQVIQGGKLSNNKGINRKGGGLSAAPLTDKDKEDIHFAGKIQPDYVAVSFPRSAEDIHTARRLLDETGCKAGVIAKIERAEALEALDDMIKASDAVMVARGDLAVEVGYAELPAIQKHIISRARALDKAVITATQMMESMIHSPVPTRAEVSDVANAVIDGTDAVMLSAETATGDFPDKVVQTMVEVCLASERQHVVATPQPRLETRSDRIDEAIATAAMYTAKRIKAKGIVALTETGSTPLWMSRIRSGIPIYGLSRNKSARGRMTLYRGVYPVDYDVTRYPKVHVAKEALDELIRLQYLQKNDIVIITKGDIMGNIGGANTLKIVQVE